MASKLRRLFDGVSRREILVPLLEQKLIEKGENSWPEEYAIRIYNKERKFDGYFHPSSHAEASDFLLYYMMHPQWRDKLLPPNHSPDTIMNFQVGSAFHALIQSMLIEMGLTKKEDVEVPFVNVKRNCSGTIDIKKLWIPGYDDFFPVEFKSAGHIPKAPPSTYIKQFQIYMDAGYDEPQERGIMLFLSKSSPHRFREFVIERDEVILKQVYDKWSRVMEAVALNDTSMLEWPCHDFNGAAHHECPAREICQLGRPF